MIWYERATVETSAANLERRLAKPFAVGKNLLGPRCNLQRSPGGKLPDPLLERLPESSGFVDRLRIRFSGSLTYSLTH